MADKQQPAPQKRRTGFWMKVLLVLFITGMLSIAIFFAYIKWFHQPISESPSVLPTIVVPDSARSLPGIMVDTPEFIVNLLSEEVTRYVKVSMTFEVRTESAQADLMRRMPQIRDEVIMLLSATKYDELEDLHGKLQAKDNLLRRLNALLYPNNIDAIYFTEFVIQ